MNELIDHLGNIRSVIKDLGAGSYEITSQYDYKPFGGVLTKIGEDKHHTFICNPTSGVENDAESSLRDIPTRWFGVRKPRQVAMQAYDDLVGRFFQIDPLYEKYYS